MNPLIVVVVTTKIKLNEDYLRVFLINKGVFLCIFSVWYNQIKLFHLILYVIFNSTNVQIQLQIYANN